MLKRENSRRAWVCVVAAERRLAVHGELGAVEARGHVVVEGAVGGVGNELEIADWLSAKRKVQRWHCRRAADRRRRRRRGREAELAGGGQALGAEASRFGDVEAEALASS